MTINFFIGVSSFVLILCTIVRFLKIEVRTPISKYKSYFFTAAFCAIVAFGWWFLTKGERVEDRILPPLILPSPMEVFNAFPKLYKEQNLLSSAFFSFQRVAIGFGLAVLVAVPLGVLMAAYTHVAAFFKPLALASSYVPIAVFVPLTIAWWGIDEMQKEGFLFIACFVALLPLVIKSVRDVPQAIVDVAMTKGATQWQIVRKVLFPVALADIWDHMRGIYAVGWGWIILAEVVNAKAGLGYLIFLSDRRSNPAGIFATIVVIIAVAVICDKLWAFGGRKLFPYKKEV